MKTPKYYYNQTGIVPILVKGNDIKICLITSRKKKNWILPKGIQEPGKTFIQIAEEEAFEEAGLKGKVFSKLIGTAENPKWKGICKINYYLMLVGEMYTIYPENFRERNFVDLKEAKKILPRKIFKIVKRAFNYYLEQQLT